MDTILSILVLSAIALVIGAAVLWRKGGAMKQVTLMLILAAVMIGNVLIWTVPDKDGEAPIQKTGALAE